MDYKYTPLITNQGTDHGLNADILWPTWDLKTLIRGSIVVPFGDSCLESCKVIPKRIYYEASR